MLHHFTCLETSSQVANGLRGHWLASFHGKIKNGGAVRNYQANPNGHFRQGCVKTVRERTMRQRRSGTMGLERQERNRGPQPSRPLSAFQSAAAILVVVATATTAAPIAAQDLPEDFVIKLERTSCFGECPVYSVSIDASGNVAYEGTKFVRVEGRQRDRIPTSRVAALLATAERIGFFDLRDQYRTICALTCAASRAACKSNLLRGPVKPEQLVAVECRTRRRWRQPATHNASRD